MVQVSEVPADPECVQDVVLPGLKQPDHRQQTLVQGQQVFSRTLGLTQILVQQQSEGGPTEPVNMNL